MTSLQFLYNNIYSYITSLYWYKTMFMQR